MLQTHLLGLNELSSQRIRLIRRAPEHASFFYNCIQDTTFMDLYRLNQNRQESIVEIAERFAKEQEILPDNLKRFEWVIEKLATKNSPSQLVGLAAVADYQQKHQRGEFLIGIHQKNTHIAGLALEASLLVFDFAFNQLKLHKLISFVYGYNAYSQANTLRLGLKQEALLREHIWDKRQGYIDLYQNGLLASDFRKNQQLAKLSQRLLKKNITLMPLKTIHLDLDYLQNVQKKLNQFRQS